MDTTPVPKKIYNNYDKIKYLIIKKLYVPLDIDAIDGTIEPPVIGTTIAVHNDCIGIVCPIPKAAIGVGFVFKGAIGATVGIPVQNM